MNHKLSMHHKVYVDEIEFHPHSFGDHDVRLFRWNGQLYRGINSQGVPFFTKLFQDRVIQNLAEKGLLIESELTSLSVDGYEMVVRHRCIPFTSYPNEWCAAMFKDAVLTLLNLAIELGQHGLTLGDAHPWNLLIDIDTCQPVFVDLGSVIPIRSLTWTVYEEFCRFCLYPLVLMTQGQDRIARLLMCESEGVLRSDLLKLVGKRCLPNVDQSRRGSGLIFSLKQKIPERYRLEIKRSLNKLDSSSQDNGGLDLESGFVKDIKQRSHLNFFKDLKRTVEGINLDCFQNPGLDNGLLQTTSFLKQENWTLQQKKVYEILCQLKPASILDVGSGNGWYSKLGASLGSQVIAFDTDQKCVTQLYFDAMKHKLPILPLVMDFTKSTPARGLADHWAIAAIDRFQCDMVLALGLIHEVVLKQRLNFDHIAEGLALFSKRWILVEFIPYEDQEVGELCSSSISWYTLDNFISALRKRFGHVSILPSHPESRVLLLCERMV